ncbi:hypothetical protein GCM10010451_31930 [Streptomyces virens]|uniref:Uncharacterized protein n=1 Tax=Streptomyces virens TaxID=285572 RepID=A0ABP6PPR2_9ACTN
MRWSSSYGGQPALQVTVGRVQLPSVRIVVPRLVPLPSGLAARAWLSGRDALTFRAEETFAGEGTRIVEVRTLLTPGSGRPRLRRLGRTGTFMWCASCDGSMGRSMPDSVGLCASTVNSFDESFENFE